MTGNLYHLCLCVCKCLFSFYGRTRFAPSTTDLRRQEELRQQQEVSRSYDYSELNSELQAAAARMRRTRSPSLPPIYNKPAPTCQVLPPCMPTYLTCDCVHCTYTTSVCFVIHNLTLHHKVYRFDDKTANSHGFLINKERE
jgi:hypothetical protein